MAKKYRLMKDIVIPCGSIFSCIDGEKRAFINGNYRMSLGLSDDTCGEVIYGIDPSVGDYFEVIPDACHNT